LNNLKANYFPENLLRIEEYCHLGWAG